MIKHPILLAYCRYSVPFIAVGFLALLHQIFPWLAIHNSFILFIPPVLISSWYGGIGPGILAIVLSLFTGSALFAEPPYQLSMASALDQARIAIFIIVATIINIIIAQLRNAKQIAEESESRLKQESIQKEALEASLKIALAKAEHANKTKTDFLANISHEIRTPMNAVVNVATILGTPSIPEAKKEEMIKVLQLSAESLMELLNNLLDITKIESAQVHLENASFNLKALAEDVIAILGVKAKEKGISLLLDYDADLADDFMGDSKRIRQILMNLISNAVKFTDKGGVTVRLYPSVDEISYKKTACIEVSDTGIGIPNDKLTSIFNKFSQADTSITRKYGGTGLGLPITKMLVDLMWGRILVSSAPGIGSTFKVDLPVLRTTPAKQPKIAAPKQHKLPKDISPFILLVEDYQPNILVETSILEQLGCRYEVAQTGQEALNKVSQFSFDMVLMDIQMPVMDGFETTRRIRAREKEQELPPVPIIGVTAYALDGDKRKCGEVGMNDYIAKPFNPSDLEDKMATLIIGAGAAA